MSNNRKKPAQQLEATAATHDGVLYGNDGDWVENCSALVESHSGQLQLIHWLEEREHWNQPSPAIAA